MWYVGLDVHQRMSCMCILDANGKVIKEEKIVAPWHRVAERLRALPAPFAVCYEASCGYGYWHDQLHRVAKRVVVAHPGQARLIFRSKRKNDRIDAKKLATLLFLDQVPPVHVPQADVRAWRGLIEFRRRLIGQRTRLKNALRVLLRAQGIPLPAGKRLWTVRGRQELAALELPETLALQRDMLLDDLDHLAPKIRRVERELQKRADAHPGVILLKTIPGVGIRTAEAVVAYIDDPRRFGRNKQVGSYFGLVPCEDTSVQRRLGHITGDGPSTVRMLLTEAAWQAVRHSPSVRARFERIQGGNPDRKKIAIVAIARYLACVMESMLRSGQVWREMSTSAVA